MKKTTTNTQSVSMTSRDVLTEILRKGAQDMLAEAVQKEIAQYVNQRRNHTDANGRRLVVRNGYLPAEFVRATGLYRWSWT